MFDILSLACLQNGKQVYMGLINTDPFQFHDHMISCKLVLAGRA